MHWLLKITAYDSSQFEISRTKVQDDDDSAESYFDIGHGDFQEDTGTEPDYIVWVLVSGTVRMSDQMMIDEEGRHTRSGRGPHQVATHGALWGHGLCSSEFKGRYEPSTGRLSVVIPKGQGHRYNYAMKKLYQAFPYIRKVSVFEC